MYALGLPLNPFETTLTMNSNVKIPRMVGSAHEIISKTIGLGLYGVSRASMTLLVQMVRSMTVSKKEVFSSL